MLRFFRPILPALLTLVFTAAAQAQLVNDGATATVTTTINLGTTNLVVGNTGPNTTLNITSGGNVTAANGLLGNSSPASTSNLLAVSGHNSTLTIPGGGSVLRIGNDSAFNTLSITSGGSVSDGFGVIGFPAFATNNSVLIANSGSVWSNGNLYVGEQGSGNSLTVSGGGLAVTSVGIIGKDTTATNNSAVVTGANSLWNVTSQLDVGDQGVGSLLRVGSGGTVNTPSMEIGNQLGASNRLEVLGGSVNVTNSSANAVFEARSGTMEFNGGVTTADEILVTNTTGKVVFNDGTLITRSAIIKNGQNFVVGANPGTGPSGAVLANTSQITIPAGAAGTIGPASPYPSTINVSGLGGTITKVTATISNLTHNFPSDVDFLLVSPDGAAVVLMAGAGGVTPVSGVTLTFDDSAGSDLADPLTSGTYLCLQAANRSLPAPAPAANLSVGYPTLLSAFNGSNPNGAWSLFVAQDAAHPGNSGKLVNGWSLMIVTTTPAATWDVRSNAAVFTTVVGDLDIGAGGNNATLLVTNGAFFTINTNFNLGLNAGSTGNLAIIGPGHVVNDATVQVGAGGTLNTLLITNSNGLTNGSSLTTLGDVYIGVGDFRDSSQGDNNLAVVTGPASKWLTTGLFFVGFDGSFNSLVIGNGGRASSGGGADIGEGVGNGSSGNNNQVTVTGANSLWTPASVSIGANGLNNTLQINSSGAVQTGGAILGESSTSAGNLLSVGGGALTVTNSAANAALDVRRGSLAFNGGNITADQLLLTNGSSGTFSFENGTLVTRTATLNNGQDFLVGTAVGTGAAGAAFTNGAAIAIPNPAFGTAGPGLPYPSVINVFNLAGSVASVTVTVSNLYHTFPSDVDLVLVSPDGTAVELLSAAGGSPDAVGLTLTFDDASPNVPPIGPVIPPGTYHPSSYRGENLPAPAPAGPYATNLATFAGLSPNGAWSLYVNDNVLGDSGTLSNGWSLKLVTLPAATWDVRSNAAPTTVARALDIGSGGPNASLLVTNGATLSVGLGADGTTSSVLGVNGSDSNNLAVIAGPGSLWTNRGVVLVGGNGTFNTLLITNGGHLAASNFFLGSSSGANNNQAIVNGPNSVLNGGSISEIGGSGSFNSLVITNGGSVQAPRVYVGLNSTSTGNLLTVGGGSLTSTNGALTGLLEVRRGQLVFNDGDITANSLMMTNGLGAFTFNAGDLDVMSAIVSNGAPFIVGDGADEANYCMSSLGGSHTFANGIIITNNASLTGSGLIIGTLTVTPGGTLSPGETNIGIINLSSSPVLQGSAFMEISKNGSLKTSDTVQVFSHPLAYGGSLTVSNRGPSALALNDTFPLFIGTSFSGVFAPVSFPALPAGLMWRNNLPFNGTIVVVPKTSPVITGLTQSGANLSFNVTGGSPGNPWSLLSSTNLTLPVSGWTTNSSGVFDWLGNVTVTNGIDTTEPSRFFLIFAP